MNDLKLILFEHARKALDEYRAAELEFSPHALDALNGGFDGLKRIMRDRYTAGETGGCVMNSARSIYFTALAGLAAIGTITSQYLGGWDGLTKLLAFVMAADYLTGVLCALVWHKSPKTATGGYESRAGFKGLIRKGVIILIVMIAAELDKLAGTTAMRTATILFFAANDGMSILENLGIMGVPYPPALKNAFEVLRRKSEDKDDGNITQTSTVDTSSAEEYQPQHELPGDPYADLKEDMDYKDYSGLLDGEDDDINNGAEDCCRQQGRLTLTLCSSAHEDDDECCSDLFKEEAD